MYYFIWLISAFVAVAVGIFALSVLDRKDKK